MTIQKNILLHNAQGRPMATDIFFEATGSGKPAVLYAHGFNGFKDWGNFDLIAAAFARAGFVFVKFNFSGNGTTPEQPEVFADLDAYAQNNYTRELSDLGTVIDWVTAAGNPFFPEIDEHRIALLGHSLGGGIAILKAAEDDRVKALATWASIAECQTPWGSWTESRLQEWKNNGIWYVPNSRTGQQMPLGYQLYEDYQQNKERLNTEQAARSLKIPFLICHGTDDPAVPVEKAYALKQWQPAAKLFTVASDHVFGRKHPWPERTLPAVMTAIIEETIRFYQQVFS